jgi:hypothetical protein
MKIENVRIGEIKPYKRNAKRHPPEQVEHIANSIREFGWQQPLVIDKDGVGGIYADRVCKGARCASIQEKREPGVRDRIIN